MAIRSVSFDDSSDNDLFVFSGYELMLSHYDVMDLDWREVAERTEIDERRGLVVLQVAILEEIIDEFILYLEDPSDEEQTRIRLSRQTIGPRIDQLGKLLRQAGLHDAEAAERIADLRRVTERRNVLAHGTIHLQVVGGALPRLGERDFDVEWVIRSRRSGQVERITTSRLREDLYDAIGAFTGMLSFAESLEKRAPRPMNFTNGTYVSARQRQ
jgi:hypothetical protein